MKIWLLALCVGSAISAQAFDENQSPAAVLTDSTGQLRLEPFIDVLEDPGHTLTIDQISSPERAGSKAVTGSWKTALVGRPGVFVHGGDGVPNFGFAGSAFWLRMRLRNDSALEQWYLETAYSQLDHVDLYVSGSSGRFELALSAGDQVPLSSASAGVVRNIYPTFDLSIPRGTVTVYYLRIRTGGSAMMPAVIYKPAQFSIVTSQHAMMMWLYTGIMIAMLLYNLFLFISLKDRSYLYYSIYMVSLVFSYLTLDGMARLYLWPDSPFLANNSMVFVIWFAMITGLIFSESFLYLRAHSPKLRRIAFALIGYGIILLGLQPFLSYAVAVQFAVGSFPFFLALVFIMGIVSFRRGFRPARYFLLAWTAFILFTVMLALRAFGIVPENIFTANASMIGSAVEAMLLSFGLADRINVLSAERKTAEAEAARLRGELKEKQKMAVIGDMAASIVHDLKNPVAVIKGYMEMADDESVSREKRSQYLRTVDQVADQMLDMVQDLLEFSRGSIALEKKSVQVAEYLERVRLAIQPNFEAKGIRFSVGSELTGSIELDPDRFLRAILNIAGNAADALPAGGQFEIKIREHRQGKDRRIILELADNGPGIPESIRAKLFDPFVTYGKSQGTGLGMAITKNLVEAHGGSIAFTTATGLGTTFTIEVPG